jgi:hypothetical protein
MVFEADTLRDTIDTNWGLTGRLAKPSAAAAGVFPVYIYAWKRSSIDEVATKKAVEIRKETPKENVTQHPNFEIVDDVFQITCYYELSDIDSDIWDAAESDMEDICEEVLRILDTVYSPSAGTGAFFTVTKNWTNQDDLRRTADPILRRVLTFTLSKVRSPESEVFEGFSGVLTFDVSESDNMDSAPGGDYIYTEAERVRISEGTEVLEQATRS